MQVIKDSLAFQFSRCWTDFDHMMYFAWCSGNPHDSMVVLKQESQFAKANDNSFFHVIRYFLISSLLPSSFQFVIVNHLELQVGFSQVILESVFHWFNACLFQFNLQIEQGIPVLSKWIIFNRFKFVASKGMKLGPAFLLTRLVFDMVETWKGKHYVHSETQPCGAGKYIIMH